MYLLHECYVEILDQIHYFPALTIGSCNVTSTS